MLKEDELFLKFRDNKNELAFSELFGIINSWLPNLIFRIVRDTDAAKDIVQDAWIKIIENKKNFDPVWGSVKSMILTYARNDALKFIKKNKRKSIIMQQFIDQYLFITEDNSFGENLNKEEIKLLLQTFITLPLKCQIVLGMYYFDNFKYREIADILDKELQWVRNWILRCKENLAGIMTQSGFHYGK